MPYGYEKYRLRNGISPNTTIHEVSLIRSLLRFINKKYDKFVEPHEIRPIDIKEFLDQERKSGLKDSTIKRKIGQIKSWFNYMWEIEKIKVDFMPKLKYGDKLDTTPSKITIHYEELLKIKKALYNESQISPISKQFFLLFMRGIRIRDITEIQIDDFVDEGDIIKLHIETHGGQHLLLEFDDEDEIKVILTGIENAIFRNTPYFISSKINNEYTQFSQGTMKNVLEALSAFTGYPIRSEEMRQVYIHYLYRVKKLSMEEIAELIGVSMVSISHIINKSLERMERVDYNQKENIS